MNPELQRNAWLELTPARLGFITIAVALVYGVLSTLPDMMSGEATTFLLYLVTGLWGSRRAADAVPSEVEGRTWDTQRLSAIDPWSMCWGKLLGATSLAWFTTALVLLGHAAIGGAGWPALARTVTGCALFQATSFFVSVLLLRTGGRRVRGHTTLAQLVGFCSLFSIAAFSAPSGWHGLRFGPDLTQALGFAILTVLALFGAWRAMRVELQYRNLPWGIVVALVALLVVQAGRPLSSVMFDGGPQFDWTNFLSGGTALGAATVIFALTVTTLLAPKDPVAIRTWIVALRSGNTVRALEYQPIWITALVVALLATVVGVVTSERDTGFLLPGWLLLMLRDSALVLAFTMGAPFARSHLAAIVVLALLHMVLPHLASFLLSPDAALLFRPQINAWPVSLLLQAVVAVGLAFWRLRGAGAVPAALPVGEPRPA